MKLTAVIVDDEPPARDIIKEYLADFGEIELIAECKNGHQAVKVINRKKPGLAFLDIQMPGLNGFEVLEHLHYFPHLIFTTAYDQFAIQAFEVNAVDYLLKPFTRKRFATAVRRVLKENRTESHELDRLISLLQDAHHAELPSKRIFVRVGHKIIPVNLEEILWIEAEGDYSQLHLKDKSFICNSGLGALEKRLDSGRFARVHRSYILALPALKHLQSDGEGGYIATIADGAKIKISRSYAPKIRKLIL